MHAGRQSTETQLDISLKFHHRQQERCYDSDSSLFLGGHVEPDETVNNFLFVWPSMESLYYYTSFMLVCVCV